MLIRDLITKLKEIEANCPEYLQPAEIMIDVFEECGEHKFVYRGFSPDVKITKSGDGTYDILTAFIDTENKFDNP